MACGALPPTHTDPMHPGGMPHQQEACHNSLGVPPLCAAQPDEKVVFTHGRIGGAVTGTVTREASSGELQAWAARRQQQNWTAPSTTAGRPVPEGVVNPFGYQTADRPPPPIHPAVQHVPQACSAPFHYASSPRPAFPPQRFTTTQWPVSASMQPGLQPQQSLGSSPLPQHQQPPQLYSPQGHSLPHQQPSLQQLPVPTGPLPLPPGWKDYSDLPAPPSHPPLPLPQVPVLFPVNIHGNAGQSYYPQFPAGAQPPVQHGEHPSAGSGSGSGGAKKVRGERARGQGKGKARSMPVSHCSKLQHKCQLCTVLLHSRLPSRQQQKTMAGAPLS